MLALIIGGLLDTHGYVKQTKCMGCLSWISCMLIKVKPGNINFFQYELINTGSTWFGVIAIWLWFLGKISILHWKIGNGNTRNLKPGKASSFPQYWVFTFIDVYFIYVVSGPLPALIIGLILALGFFIIRCLCTLLDKRE